VAAVAPVRGDSERKVTVTAVCQVLAIGFVFISSDFYICVVCCSVMSEMW